MIKKILLRFIIPFTVVGGAGTSAAVIPIAIERSKHKGIKTDITINMRVMDWGQLQAYDQSIYDEDHYVRTWEYSHGSKTPKMLPYEIDNTWHVSSTSAYTMGDLLQKIQHDEPDSIKFNIDDRIKAGPMGRILWGVKKSDKEIAKQADKFHNLYWGVHEVKNSTGDWIYTSGWDKGSTYLSLSSPNNEYAVSNSHTYFDLNESFFTFDHRLSKGIDGIYIAPGNILNINTWKII